MHNKADFKNGKTRLKKKNYFKWDGCSDCWVELQAEKVLG